MSTHAPTLHAEDSTAAPGDPTPPQVHEDRALLARYLDLLNRAITRSKQRFPYRVVLEALRNELGGRIVHVTLADDSGRGTALACRFEGSRLAPTMGRDRGREASSLSWTLARDHVHDVMARPWHYLVDPQRFELPPFSVCTAG